VSKKYVPVSNLGLSTPVTDLVAIVIIAGFRGTIVTSPEWKPPSSYWALTSPTPRTNLPYRNGFIQIGMKHSGAKVANRSTKFRACVSRHDACKGSRRCDGQTAGGEGITAKCPTFCCGWLTYYLLVRVAVSCLPVDRVPNHKLGLPPPIMIRPHFCILSGVRLSLLVLRPLLAHCTSPR
jgi:hypothetical protein